ncbi:NCS1 family nucleobase:cation symporter-1 [Roseateles asaccharophilus]|uniref:NCS1 family nucleobase:cation symporter-1 n=1 Tax=Roseateles asaccharophilus TaxID=582607 RepID=A0ABU2A673_9BURK|nr:NCS1 family nucleobase:cation symporter-1 [Roseateles asaccharophilus]MDR7332696.1 NCS1 family nucleobase:cation symporter-1 [Roseateles asaccharophilus]
MTDPSLSNHDLVPTTSAQRTWGWKDFAALWVGMVVCVPTYTMASSMLDQGFSWQQAVWLVLLANLIVLIPMVLIGRVGPKHGIPFPVLARASFGVKGASLPAVLRGLVACGWFSINCYFGALALHSFLNVLGFGLAAPAAGETISTSQFACFIAFWALHLWFIWRGTESIRLLEVIAAPLMIGASAALVVWLMMSVPSAQLFGLPAKEVPGGPNSLAALTGLVGFWATLALNIPDFTRFAKTQRDQVVGQAIGLPVPMALFSMVGVIGFSASAILYGKAELFPDALLAKMGPVAAGIGLLVILLANLTTNVAANLVSPSYDFSQLAPSKISFRMGGLIAAVIGLLFMPWKLLATSGGYLFTWLGGYGTLLGAIAGILLTDYYLIRRTELNSTDLYRRGGEYEYSGGWNVRAIVALLLGVLPCLPGYLVVSGVLDKSAVAPALVTLFSFGWFFSLAVSGAVYFFSMPRQTAAQGAHA